MKYNKPRTAKVGAISKAQNLKGGPFGLCETPAGCKKFKKIEGGTLWRHEKNSQKKIFNEIFEQCHSAEKCKRGDPLQFFWPPLCCKISKQMKGDPLVQPKKNFKKSRIVPKKSGAKVGSLVCFRGCGRLFCFFFSFWTRFWGWSCWGLKLLRFEVVEQMNKKVDLSCLKKKTTHCNSRAHFLLKCAD